MTRLSHALRLVLLTGVSLTPGLGPVAEAQITAVPCDSVPGFHALDFWVGQWEVVDSTRQRHFGRNRIEKVLDGCAVTETWMADGGGDGMSLFYYNALTDVWKQVWVTENATRPGGLKEKRLVARFEDGSIRFQGELPRQDGGTYLDRTTLTPLPDGAVRQHIEISVDGGATWRTTFDAHYLPHH